MRKLKIAQFGLGPIGLETLNLAATKPWAEIVGAIDFDAAKVGKDLGTLTSIKRLRGLKVCRSLDELLQKAKPQIVFHTTVSRFKLAFEQLEPIARRGLNVVSSCEELIFPQLLQPNSATRLDRLCRANGARIVAAGVNPGFVMDLLPLCMTGICREVRAVHVQRVVDAATRREPLQRKIGSGLPRNEFQRRLKAGQAGHAGLKESLALLAHGLGWKLEGISETGKAVIAQQDIRTQYLHVKKGQTCGLHQRAEARIRGKLRLSLDLKMFLNAPDPHDALQIEGDPPLDMVINGGVAGDQATVAALVNTAPRLLKASPGLLLPTDLLVPRFG